jgi:hypothetical protein
MFTCAEIGVTPELFSEQDALEQIKTTQEK